LSADIRTNYSYQFQKILVINLPARTDHKDAFILSSAVTGIKGTFIDGIDGKDVSNKSLPHGDITLSEGNKGSWRAHLNAIQQCVFEYLTENRWRLIKNTRIVAQDLSSALIVEDDVDWDIHLKSQLYAFAGAVQVLTQPLASNNARYADPTFPTPSEGMDPEEIHIGPNSLPPATLAPHLSPYGDNWDMLWLGHCGTRFPDKERDRNLPRGRVLLADETVPASQHVSLQFGTDELVTRYANHTRAVHHTAEGVCSLAYAVTQRAARQILYDLGLKKLRGPFDIMLREYCDGLQGRKVRNCYTAQPQYFQHHRPIGYKSKNSDINGVGDGDDEFNPNAHTFNIRWSTRMNMQRLVDGDTDFEDQWPDDAPATNKTY
jgi:hypothetical protein